MIRSAGRAGSLSLPETREAVPRRPAQIAPDAESRVHSVVIPGLWLRPADLFADDRPSELSVLAELGAA